MDNTSDNDRENMEQDVLKDAEDKFELIGCPIQIVKINDDDHTFMLDEEALSQILEKKSVKDKPICVVSVAGAFRRGKSFLLDFMLRYLCRRDSDDWMGENGDENTPLQGFHWRGGAERDTTGILVWSEVFEISLPNGKEVAVLLMDTQGAFDSNSTVKDCATIFALSAMLSSVLVYNLTSNIQEDDLQHLQLFTEYGRLALEDIGETPFQKLQFLVRDWSYPYEAEYGAEGGKQILERRLQVSDKQHPELQALRKHIASCFGQIDGFLMPHPGLKVATDKSFDGKLKDIEPLFKQHLKVFVPKILSPENLVLKKIGGNEVKCRDLMRYFNAYMDIFKGNEMPEPKSMLEATSEANNLASLSEAKDYYTHSLEAVCGGDKPYLNEHVLEVEHQRIRQASIEVFTSKRKMGGEEFSLRYRQQLEKEIDESYENYKSHNESKNIFRAANTPITLAAVIMLVYLTCQVMALIGLYSIANLLNMAMIFSFMLLATWSYVKYTGNLAHIGSSIDELTLSIWESALQPAFNRLAREGTDFAARQAMQRLNSSSSSSSSHPSYSQSKKKN